MSSSVEISLSDQDGIEKEADDSLAVALLILDNGQLEFEVTLEFMGLTVVTRVGPDKFVWGAPDDDESRLSAKLREMADNLDKKGKLA